MARPQVAGGGTASSMQGTANILNEQSRTADKGWSSSLWGLGEVLTTPRRKNVSSYELFTQKDSDMFSGTCECGNEPYGVP